MGAPSDPAFLDEVLVLARRNVERHEHPLAKCVAGISAFHRGTLGIGPVTLAGACVARDPRAAPVHDDSRHAPANAHQIATPRQTRAVAITQSGFCGATWSSAEM